MQKWSVRISEITDCTVVKSIVIMTCGYLVHVVLLRVLLAVVLYQPNAGGTWTYRRLVALVGKFGCVTMQLFSCTCTYMYVVKYRYHVIIVSQIIKPLVS